MELPLVFGFSFVAVVFFCYFYIILHIFDMFFFCAAVCNAKPNAQQENWINEPELVQRAKGQNEMNGNEMYGK